MPSFSSVHCFQSSSRYIITTRPPLMIICQQEEGGKKSNKHRDGDRDEARQRFSAVEVGSGLCSRRGGLLITWRKGRAVLRCEVGLLLISKVQTRLRHPSSSPMTDCYNYSGILSDGGCTPAECCVILGFREGDMKKLSDRFTFTGNDFYEHISNRNEKCL